LRWLENAKNEGPAATRNTAVAISESNCILPLDSDDMLASNEVLETMYDTWAMDKNKVIYGNVQLYQLKERGFERSKVYQLAHYSFEGAMNLQFGIMPVTVMHSKEAHHRAGGWKPILKYGREDLEYHIACGKAGYCGHKINHTTLLYRKHEQSRDYRLKFELQELETMQNKIREMHSDVYGGNYPMACCGGKGKSSAPSVSVDPVILSEQNQSATRITTLEGYNEKDLEWVAYYGPKKGGFSVLTRGPSNLPSDYMVFGYGHVFQIHKKHHNVFSQRQRLHFRVNQPDPRQKVEIVSKPTKQPEPQVVKVDKPELSTLVRLDNIGNQTKEVEIVKQEVIIEPNAPDSYSDIMIPQSGFHLLDLNISESLTNKLENAGYDIDLLSKTTPQELSSLPGIGVKRANIIISKARELIISNNG
jgi:hypothetical protein